MDERRRAAFAANDVGRWPTTVIATAGEVIGQMSHVFVVPKVRNVMGHPCSKPIELLTHLVKLRAAAGLCIRVQPLARRGLQGAAGAQARRQILDWNGHCCGQPA